MGITCRLILAKVLRDREMTELSDLYPDYGFADHRGYGTASHVEAIRRYGYCAIHCKTFRLKALQPSLFEYN